MLHRVVVRLAAISHQRKLLTIRKSDGSFALPGIRLIGNEIPDLSALELGNQLIGGKRLSLVGGFSHGRQLTEGPLMLTMPMHMAWRDGTLSLCYAAVFDGNPSDGLMLPIPNIGDGFGNGVGRSLRTAMEIDPCRLEVTYDENSIKSALEARKVDTVAKSPKDMTVAVFVNAGDRTVLLRHKKLEMWLPPGGHVEDCESPDMAAVREVKEETGLDIRLRGGTYPANPHSRHTVSVGRYGDSPDALTIPMGVQLEKIGEAHHHIDFVYFSSPSDERPLSSCDESQAIGWYGRNEALDLDLTNEMRLWCSKVWECRSLSV